MVKDDTKEAKESKEGTKEFKSEDKQIDDVDNIPIKEMERVINRCMEEDRDKEERS